MKMPHCSTHIADWTLPKLLLGVFVVLAVVVVFQACGSDEPLELINRTCPVDGANSGEEMHQDPNQLACDNSNFAFDLYRALSGEKEKEENLFFSPYSISQVLAMAYAGARGETERQMADALRYALPQDRLHPAFDALDVSLHSRGEDAYNPSDSDEDNPNFRLNIANAVWGQDGFGFRREYLDTLADYYGDEMRGLNFAASPEESRVTINDWIAEATEDKIKDLIPRGAINSFTRFVLTNAIYFNAQWLEPFYPDATEDRPFYLLYGKRVQVPMMTGGSSEGWFGYARGDGYQAIDVPYYTDGMSMVVVLPDKGKFEDLEDSLAAGILDEIRVRRESRDLTLHMPRFEFEFAFMPKAILVELGMQDAFTEAADFSGIADEIDLMIADIFHKAFVSVNEEGTEAAAATALTGVPTSYRAPLEPITVTLDRPFIFLIRDEPTGTILFLGRVMDPS